jgi:hypothetical protein
MELNELTIYRKTAKGIEELQTRAHGLEQRFRRPLFIVDGVKDVAQLSVVMRPGEAEVALAKLAEGGYIEALGDDEVPANIVRYVARADDPAYFAQVKITMQADFAERLGAFAEMVVAEVESCNTALELRLKLRDIEDILVAALGPDDGINLAREIGHELTQLVPREGVK